MEHSQIYFLKFKNSVRICNCYVIAYTGLPQTQTIITHSLDNVKFQLSTKNLMRSFTQNLKLL